VPVPDPQEEAEIGAAIEGAHVGFFEPHRKWFPIVMGRYKLCGK